MHAIVMHCLVSKYQTIAGKVLDLLTHANLTKKVTSTT